MNAELLNVKWSKISSSNIVNGYKLLRISDDCASDVYIGINGDGCHTLILHLPDNHRVHFKAVKKEKLSIELLPNTTYLIMTLNDGEFNNLFDDLIVSLFNAIKDIQDVEVYSKVFIQTFYQWILFFSPANEDMLSKDMIKGLWGELVVLKELIEVSDSYDINNVLSGWTGPYDQGHDFIYDDINIEVKTKHFKKVFVSISSEHQLTIEAGKKLNLTVVSIDDDLLNGCSLKLLVLKIKELIFERLGDFSIILKALLQKGVTLQNIQEYDNYRFKLLTIHDYDCLKEGFPKIITTSLPSSLSNVKYDLNLTSLAAYIVLLREF
jgi:hypothetical protein